MTVSTGSPAACPATNGTAGARRRDGLSGLARLSCACLLILTTLAPTAFAETMRVSANADPGLTATQGRQQALGRALVEAVYQEALRLLTPAPPQARLDALRAYLAPNALDFVQSYQEANAALPAQNAESKAQEGKITSAAGVASPQVNTTSSTTVATPAQTGATPPSGTPAPATNAPLSTTLDLDVNIQRAYLRDTLLRLGFLAGAHHPGIFLLRLGNGVKERDTQLLAPGNILLGLARVKPTAAQGDGLVEVSLERLPQGYYKAVLRQDALALAADSPDLSKLWLDIWAKYFTDSHQQPGPGSESLTIAGFAGVDAVQDFVRLLGAWDEAVQDPSLADMDLGVDGVSARFTCRVINQGALDARLHEALPVRKLTLMSQTGQTAP